MHSKQNVIEYFMQILAMEKEMESESAFMLEDIPNGELKNLLNIWHNDELRHVQIAQSSLDLIMGELAKRK